MIITVEGKLFEDLVATIEACTAELANSRKLVQDLQDQIEGNRLLNEEEADACLNRDSDTLLYYRRLGLPYFKKGKSVWYRKSDIDNWLVSGKVTRRKRD